MGVLVEQLAGAIAAWGETVTPDETNEAAVFALLYLGGSAQPTPENVRARLDYLLEREHMFEEFLIVGMVLMLDRWFESRFEDYAKHKHRARLDAAQLEADPSEAPNAANIIALLKDVGAFSVADQLRFREYRDAWRRLIAPILDPDNLERHRWDRGIGG